HAFQRFRDIIEPAGADARWLLIGAETPVEPRDVEVGWLSADLFSSGLLAKFFDTLRDAPHLKWVQSAAAGIDGPWFVLRHYQRPAEWAAAQAEHADRRPLRNEVM